MRLEKRTCGPGLLQRMARPASERPAPGSILVVGVARLEGPDRDPVLPGAGEVLRPLGVVLPRLERPLRNPRPGPRHDESVAVEPDDAGVDDDLRPPPAPLDL